MVFKWPKNAIFSLHTNIFEMPRQGKQTYQQLARVFTIAQPLQEPAKNSNNQQRKH